MNPTTHESAGREQEPGSVDLSILDIYQLVELFVMLLQEQALRYMGVRADPSEKEVAKDAVKAHVAIDCMISLVDKIEPYLTGAEKDRLRSLITDLQLGYAKQMK